MSEPGFYSSDAETRNEVVREAQLVEQELAKSYARWEELENL